MQKAASAVVVHGGAGAGVELSIGCVPAVQAAERKLAAGEDALAAAVAAVMVLEDDPRFNAGSGAVLGLDGVTIELDAALMDSRGKLGAVAALRAVKNPILVALDVARSPHCLLVGEGAQRFARLMGHAPHQLVSEQARHKHAQLLARLAQRQPQAMTGVANADFARYWNYNGRPDWDGRAGCDTVGAVVRDADGHFAVAGSTGGSAPALLGRVGDTPIIGSGFYAGPHGAVAATGIGEYIMRQMLASRVYHWIADGVDLHLALRRGIALMPPGANTGLIAVSSSQSGWYSNADMPTATT